MAMDCSKLNNREYFIPLHNAFKDKTIMRKFFEELMTRDISNWDPVNDRRSERDEQELLHPVC